MTELNLGRWRRHQLVTAAHDFILAVLPFRYPDSSHALTRFVAFAWEARASPEEAEVVFLDVLAVLNARAPCPDLLARYVVARRQLLDPMTRFNQCAGELIRSRAVGDRQVEQAIAIIEARYRDDTLTQAGVAAQVGLSATDLSSRFRRHTGRTFTEFLRHTRLDAAAMLLQSTDWRVKEIWVSVGYNDASNFGHEFKDRYSLSPRAYRRSAIGPRPVAVRAPRLDPVIPLEPVSRVDTVLIVDDHDNTRETVGRYLRAVGYDVVLSATGADGLSAAGRITPRTVVLDYQLPDMTGLDWLRKLRQRQCESSVIVFTADWEAAEQRLEIESLGARLVSKLCDIDDLVHLIGLSARSSANQTTSRLPRERN